MMPSLATHDHAIDMLGSRFKAQFISVVLQNNAVLLEVSLQFVVSIHGCGPLSFILPFFRFGFVLVL